MMIKIKTLCIGFLICLTFYYDSFCQLEKPCPRTGLTTAGAFATESFSALNGWVYDFDNYGNTYPAGTLSITGGEVFFNDVHGAKRNRYYKDMGPSLYTSYKDKFRAEFALKVDGGFCPNHYVMAFTTNNLEPFTNCPEVNNSGFYLFLSGDPSLSGPCNISTCGQYNGTVSPWRLQLYTKNGSNEPVASPGFVLLPYINDWLYIRMIRSANDLCLSIYSDPAFTNLIGNDCWLNCIVGNPSVRYAQTGVSMCTFNCRTITMHIDNLVLYSYSAGGQYCAPLRYASNQSSEILQSGFSIYPNPSQGLINIRAKEQSFLSSITITDIAGNHVKRVNNIELTERGFDLDLANLKNGIYILDLSTESEIWKSKIILNK